MFRGICIPCQYGEHGAHTPIIQTPPPGMLGGACCKCEGECVDGRYIPDHTKELIDYLAGKEK